MNASTPLARGIADQRRHCYLRGGCRTAGLGTVVPQFARGHDATIQASAIRRGPTVNDHAVGHASAVDASAIRRRSTTRKYAVGYGATRFRQHASTVACESATRCLRMSVGQREPAEHRTVRNIRAANCDASNRATSHHGCDVTAVYAGYGEGVRDRYAGRGTTGQRAACLIDPIRDQHGVVAARRIDCRLDGLGCVGPVREGWNVVAAERHVVRISPERGEERQCPTDNGQQPTSQGGDPAD